MTHACALDGSVGLVLKARPCCPKVLSSKCDRSHYGTAYTCPVSRANSRTPMAFSAGWPPFCATLTAVRAARQAKIPQTRDKMPTGRLSSRSSYTEWEQRSAAPFWLQLEAHECAARISPVVRERRAVDEAVAGIQSARRCKEVLGSGFKEQLIVVPLTGFTDEVSE